MASGCSSYLSRKRLVMVKFQVGPFCNACFSIQPPPALLAGERESSFLPLVGGQGVTLGWFQSQIPALQLAIWEAWASVMSLPEPVSPLR